MEHLKRVGVCVLLAHLSPLAVRIQLGSPLLQRSDVRHLVALCATADVLIERVAKLKLHAKSFDVRILQEIEAACRELSPEKHPQVHTLKG